MKRTLLAGMMVLALAANSWALLFNFSGTSADGTGSATMDISIAGSMLTATLNNTSPILTANNLLNMPGIPAFGFNLTNNPRPTINSWSLTAIIPSTSAVINLDSTGTNEWRLQTLTQIEGVELGFFPNNSGAGAAGNVDALLYNPLLTPFPDQQGNNTRYFTTAVLTIDFSDAPLLDITAGVSPYVRMQRVGDSQAGSLKLFGVPDNGGGPGPVTVIPEPSTIILLGAGLLGLGLANRRKFKL